MSRSRILILDDERSGVQHLHDALDAHHSVHYCRNILDAKRELERHEYDLVICSVHLLNESMFDFLHDVKQTAHSRGIPFVCFRAVETKLGQQLDAQIETAARALGAVEYLVVETNQSQPEVLRQRIERQLLSKRRSR
jgi:PleD family two-component response regulator